MSALEKPTTWSEDPARKSGPAVLQGCGPGDGRRVPDRPRGCAHRAGTGRRSEQQDGGPGATRGLKLAPGASAQGTPAREPAEAEVAATSAVSRSSPVRWGLGGQHRPRLQPCRERRASMG